MLHFAKNWNCWLHKGSGFKKWHLLFLTSGLASVKWRGTQFSNAVFRVINPLAFITTVAILAAQYSKDKHQINQSRSVQQWNYIS